MSLRDLRDLASPPKPTPPGQPLPRPVELEPVPRKKKEPRSSLSRVGPKRTEKKARQFGEQAARCRLAPCACCGVRGASEPHHWPTVARGGLDADTCPLCPKCHDVFHDQAGSPEAFLVLMGCDVLEAIERMRRKPDHSCERLSVLRENAATLRSEYVCTRCGAVLPDEQDS